MLLAATSPAFGALEALSDAQMSRIEGSGLAVSFDDFTFRFAPTSYIELTGQEPTAGAASVGWRRGDVRYYGFAISGGGATGTDWYDDGCTNSHNLCPIGNTGTNDFAPVNNPYVLRAFQIEGYNPSGNLLSGASRPTHMELVGPTKSLAPWRWAFWGEIEVDRLNTYGDQGVLQSQTIIRGNNHTLDNKPSIFRIFQTENTTIADRTLGFTYQSALSGDFRFSVGQTSVSPDLRNEVPNFNNYEGVYFKNVDAFIPLGRLHSQALTLDGLPDGNFVLELTPVPNNAYAYNDFYCNVDSNSSAGCATVTKTLDFFEVQSVSTTSPSAETHGYVHWGDPTGNLNSTDNGVFFQDSAGNPTTLGVSTIDGLMIQSLKLTTLGI